MWVDQNGGDSKLLKFVEIPNTAQAISVAEHRVDAAVLQQPDLARALEGGKVKVLGLAYSAISPNFMFAGWFAMNDWAAKHADLVKIFNRVAADAARYTNAHHAETAPMLADASKIPLTVIEKMNRVDSSTALDPTIIQPIIDASAKYKMLAHGFPAKDLIFSAP
jgi:ABC-type nitrate/sulfonate/bicarbonate transport system substrate-binding protein